MKAPIDLTKLRKSVAKSIPGLSIGFNDPKTWLSTGCYALNYLISGDFKGGIPLEGKFTMFAGDSGCLPEYAKVTARVESIVRELTVKELRDLYHSDEYIIELSTPDGWQPVISWWDKGVLPMVKIVTTDGLSTTCATNHLVECIRDDATLWIPAESITENDVLLTVNGTSVVSGVDHNVPDQECYDFEIGHENHRYFGDGISSHNSGKSYITSANILKTCQEKGVFPFLIDTENALDESWLKALGVDTSFMEKISGATVDDVTNLMVEIIDQYKSDYAETPYENRPRMLIVIDSLGMLITPTMIEQASGEKGKKMTGDMGIKAKQITHMIRVIMAKIASEPIGLLATNHVMDAQDEYAPDKIPGGKMLEFASSVIVQMNKYLLKEDEDGVKLTDGKVAGIRTTAVVRKSRYAKPFEKIKIDIPYDRGMDAYSGLFDLFVAKGAIQKDGMRWTYTSPVTGEVVKDWRKNFKKTGILDQIMAEWDNWEIKAPNPDFKEYDPNSPDDE